MGVATESRTTTTWCCLFTRNKTIQLKPGGSLSLFYKKKDQVQQYSEDYRLCDFGYDEMTNCLNCLQKGKWEGTWEEMCDNNEIVRRALNVTLNFAAEDCSTFTGNFFFMKLSRAVSLPLTPAHAPPHPR